VAACFTPVISAIGHEQDTPLLDLVADLRASTPTDAARRIVPDVREEQTRLRQAQDRLTRGVQSLVQRETAGLTALRSRPVLSDPVAGLVAPRVAEITSLRERAHRTITHRLDRAADELRHTQARVRALSPAATLERGYAVVQTADGAVVRDPTAISAGDPLRVRVAGGAFAATVTDTP
jgi:exodeoxyribonuclease VII large subunit